MWIEASIVDYTTPASILKVLRGKGVLYQCVLELQTLRHLLSHHIAIIWLLICLVLGIGRVRWQPKLNVGIVFSLSLNLSLIVLLLMLLFNLILNRVINSNLLGSAIGGCLSRSAGVLLNRSLEALSSELNLVLKWLQLMASRLSRSGYYILLAPFRFFMQLMRMSQLYILLMHYVVLLMHALECLCFLILLFRWLLLLLQRFYGLSLILMNHWRIDGLLSLLSSGYRLFHEWF